MIRDFRREDADAVAALLNEAEPPEAVTGPGIVHWQEKQPERAHVASWVAEKDGEIVGWARAAMRWAVSTAVLDGDPRVVPVGVHVRGEEHRAGEREELDGAGEYDDGSASPRRRIRALEHLDDRRVSRKGRGAAEPVTSPAPDPWT